MKKLTMPGRSNLKHSTKICVKNMKKNLSHLPKDKANFSKINWSSRRRSRAAGTSNMEDFVIIVNGWEAINYYQECSTLDVAAALDPPLGRVTFL